MHTAAPTGDPDRDFLAMMIPHHEEALAMPHLMLLRGRDPLKLQLAQEITAGQSIEISTMRARLAALQSQAEEYPTLGGTRGFARSPG
ncbi:MAG: DUF305 domain-containing protein [Pseudonocardia sp.]|nr:DUF305 domain-containing protein [Pseudonocardia sp.]